MRVGGGGGTRAPGPHSYALEREGRGWRGIEFIAKIYLGFGKFGQLDFSRRVIEEKS